MNDEVKEILIWLAVAVGLYLAAFVVLVPVLAKVMLIWSDFLGL